MTSVKRFVVVLMLSLVGGLAAGVAQGQVTAYTGFNFTGESRTFSSSVADAGTFGRRIRSFRVAKGYKLTVFRERNFGGGTQSSVTEDWSLPTGSPWVNDIRSFRIERIYTPPTPPLPPTPSDFPVIYAQANYQGPAEAIENGYPGRIDWEGQPHRIRSIRVPAGWKLTLYSERNYRGTQTTITKSISWLPGAWWNGRVRSIRVERPTTPTPGGDPVIYAQRNFNGPAMALVENWPRLKDWDGSPHHIRSIRVPQGRPIMVYSQTNYRGRSYLVTSDWAPQPGDWWYGRIRSIKIDVGPQPR